MSRQLGTITLPMRAPKLIRHAAAAKLPGKYTSLQGVATGWFTGDHRGWYVDLGRLLQRWEARMGIHNRHMVHSGPQLDLTRGFMAVYYSAQVGSQDSGPMFSSRQLGFRCMVHASNMIHEGHH